MTDHLLVRSSTSRCLAVLAWLTPLPASTQEASQSQPPPRYSVGAAYDSARGRLIVLGGVERGGDRL